MASVLIDTINLTSKDKITEHDENAAHFLTTMLHNFDQDSFFEEIHSAKQDISHLSLRDILRKDYKEWDEADMKLGIASCVKPMGYLIDKASSEMKDRGNVDAFLTIAKGYAKERELDILGVMTAFTANDQFKRELFIWAMNPKSASAAQKFEESAGKELDLRIFKEPDLTVTESSGEQWRKAWAQAGLQHSRKRVAPLLREAMGRL
jgi:exopolyphosphatase